MHLQSIRRIICVALSVAASVATVHAEEAKPASPPAAPATPSPAPATVVVKVYAPTDLEGLKSVKGQKVLVEGKVVSSGANKAQSIRYLNFTQNFRESVSLVFFANSGGGTFTKEKLAEYVGKSIQVNGTLSEHNGALQIKVEALDQIKVVPEPAPVAK